MDRQTRFNEIRAQRTMLNHAAAKSKAELSAVKEMNRRLYLRSQELKQELETASTSNYYEHYTKAVNVCKQNGKQIAELQDHLRDARELVARKNIEIRNLKRKYFQLNKENQPNV